MFDDLIKKIKEKLPFLNKDEADEVDEEMSGETETEIEAPLKNESDDGEEEEATGAELSFIDKLKNRDRSAIIKVVVVLALAYLGVDELMNKDEEVVSPVKNKKIKQVKKSKKVIPKVTPVATPTEVPVAETTPEAVSTPLPTSTPTATPEAPAEKTADGEEDVNKWLADLEKKEPVLDESVKEQEKKDVPVEVGEKGDEKKDNNSSLSEQVTNILKGVDKSDPEKIKGEYIAPPKYEYRGRGLIYNCIDRHWACVDRDSYFQCRNNYRWARANEKMAGCNIFAVYKTLDDCQTMQKYNINKPATPPSCR